MTLRCSDQGSGRETNKSKEPSLNHLEPLRAINNELRLKFNLRRLSSSIAVKRADEDRYGESEAVERREAVLKPMLATPQKPHKPISRNTHQRQSDQIS